MLGLLRDRYGPARCRTPSTRVPPWQVWSLCLLSLTAVGCTQHRAFRPATLPAEFRAPAPRSAQHVDLSRLASSARSSDHIYPGDVVDIHIVTGAEEAPTEPWPLRVAEDGHVQVPLVGPVRLAGHTFEHAEQVVQQESIRRGLYRAPTVTVTPGQVRTLRVHVAGAVTDPGSKDIPAGEANLFAALLAAGGLDEEASSVVEVRHPANNGPARVTRVDLADPQIERRPDLELHDGSVVMVMKQPTREVHVLGLVKEPGQFPMPADRELRVLQAIALAGGRTLQVADKVRVIRQGDPATGPVIIDLSLRDAKSDGLDNIALAPGDVVSVEQTPTTFAVETMRSFIRFGFTSALPGF